MFQNVTQTAFNHVFLIINGSLFTFYLTLHSHTLPKVKMSNIQKRLGASRRTVFKSHDLDSKTTVVGHGGKSIARIALRKLQNLLEPNIVHSQLFRPDDFRRNNWQFSVSRNHTAFFGLVNEIVLFGMISKTHFQDNLVFSFFLIRCISENLSPHFDWIPERKSRHDICKRSRISGISSLLIVQGFKHHKGFTLINFFATI